MFFINKFLTMRKEQGRRIKNIATNSNYDGKYAGLGCFYCETMHTDKKCWFSLIADFIFCIFYRNKMKYVQLNKLNGTLCVNLWRSGVVSIL